MNNLNVILKVTHGCNINCKYCYDAGQRAKFGKYIMPLELFKEFIYKIPSHTFVQIIFHGGEPTTVPIEWYDAAIKICSGRSDLGFKYGMQSNGFDVSDDFLDMLVRNSVSIGYSHDMFAKTRGEVDTANRVLDTLKRSKKVGLNSSAINVITSENQHKMIEMYEKAYFKYKYVPSFNMVFSTEKTIEQDVSIYADSIKKDWDSFARYLLCDNSEKNLPLEREVSSNISLIAGENGNTCSYFDCSKAWICIAPDGSLHTCDEVIPVLGAPPKIQDLEKFEDYYDTQYFHNFKYLMKELRLQCEGCMVRKVCEGGCPLRHLTKLKEMSNVKHNNDECKKQRTYISIIFTILQKMDIFASSTHKEVYKIFTRKISFSPLEVYNYLIANKGLKNTDLDKFNPELFSIVIKLNTYFGKETELKCDNMFDRAYRQDMLRKMMREVL